MRTAHKGQGGVSRFWPRPEREHAAEQGLPVPLPEGRHPPGARGRAGSSWRGSTPQRRTSPPLWWYGFHIVSMVWSGPVATTSHQFQLRIPLDLHEMLVAAAEQNERSLHREIVFRLRKSFVGEVASAATRERAGAIGLSPDEEQTPDASHDRSHGDVGDRGPEEGERPPSAGRASRSRPPVASVSLPDTERRERHERCRKRAMHHIYHGGKPCPECGYPA